MRTSSPCFGFPSYTFAALGAVALFGSTAQAADLGPSPLPPLTVPVETWTGFSFAVGGGLGIFNTNVDTSVKRKDTLEQCAPGNFLDPPVGAVILCNDPDDDLWVLNESFTNSQDLNISSLGDTGGLGTIQAAYDWQFAPRWVGGLYLDADLYWGMDASSKQQSASVNDHFGVPIAGFAGLTDFGAASTLTSKTNIGLDWGFSAGGRLGWLATPDTLLYVLAGYNRVELDKSQVNVFTNTAFHTNADTPMNLTGGCAVFNGDCPLSLRAKLPDSLDGFTVGGGTEVRLGGPWSLKLEYRYARLFGEDLHIDKDSAQGFATIQPMAGGPVGLRRQASAEAEAKIGDIDLHTVRAMLAYRF